MSTRSSPPAGPEFGRAAAFFDFDGTMVDGYSALALIKDQIRRRQVGPLDMVKLLLTGIGTKTGHSEAEDFMRAGLAVFRGRSMDDLTEMGERFTRSILGGYLFADAVERITEHQRAGHRVVIASSALPFQIEALARELGVDDVLCSRLGEVDGRCTGELDGDMLWGKPKALAVAAYAREHGVDLDASYAYGNGDEDIEFLSTVGNPRAVNPQPELAVVASGRGWQIEHFRPRSSASRLDVPRTMAAYGGMAATCVAAAGLGLLNRSRRVAANTMLNVGSEVTLALAGITVNVIGEEHAWAARPAVFIFNHQSLLDPLVVFKIVQRDVTAVGKKEVERTPLIGQLAWLLNAALIDRTDTAAARAALQPALDRIADGYSIAIAPEGTRSLTPRVGPFKKGPFHLAMQGRVPIVPIIIRNSGELMWRGSNSMRAGTLDVLVTPPISVADWDPGNLTEKVAEVRRRYVDALADWDTAVASKT